LISVQAPTVNNVFAVDLLSGTALAFEIYGTGYWNMCGRPDQGGTGMDVRFARLQYGRPVLHSAVTLVHSAVLFGFIGYLWPYESVPITNPLLLVGSCFLGGALASGSAIRRTRAAFPPGLTTDHKMAIWQVVRRGGDVEDAADASAIVHHARAVRTQPYKPLAAAVVFGLYTAINLVFAVLAFADGDRYALTWHMLLGAIAIIGIPTLINVAQYKRNAERAELQALHLLDTAVVRGMTCRQSK
jgi:hypothetical protein